MKIRLLLLAILLLLKVSTQAQTTYTDNGSNLSYNLGENESLVITSGIFSGQITQLPASATIVVEEGATFAPTFIANAAGLIKNNGIIEFNQTHSLLAGFAIMNQGTAKLWIRATQAIAGAISITTLPSATLQASVPFNLPAGSTFSNDGIAMFEQDFTIGTVSTFSNDGVMNVHGNLSIAGIMYNSGILKVYGHSVLEADAKVINKCTFLSQLSLTNSCTKFENYGYIQVFGSESTFINQEEFFNDAKGVLELVNFENHSIVSGGGKFHATGTTSNFGSFGYDGGSILFYDATSSNEQLFDNQTMAAHVSVYREEIGANDTTYISTNCNKIAFPSSPNTALPVILDKFSVSNQDCTPFLEWTTLQEINSAYFEVERKLNTESHFQAVAKVNAQGSSAVESRYEFRDESIPNGLYQYRLKMVDLDGNTSYSRVNSLTLFCGSTSEINVYPNPSQGELNITMNTNDDDLYQVAVFDMFGRRQYTGTFDFNNGLNTIRLDLAHLPSGNYNVMVTNSIQTNYVKFSKY